MRVFKLALILIPLFLFSGCFEIIHVLNLNTDGTIDVRWRFSMSKMFTENKPSEGGDSADKDPRQKMDEMKGEIERQIGRSVTNFTSSVTQTDTDLVMEVNFRTRDYVNVKTDEAFVLMPAYNPQTKQMVFHFKGDEKKAQQNPRQPAQTQGENSGSEEKPDGGMDEGMKKIGKMILSSARYQIFLGGRYSPDRAYVVLPGNVRKDLTILPIGNLFLIDFPFMSYMPDDKSGFDVVIQMK